MEEVVDLVGLIQPLLQVPVPIPEEVVEVKAAQTPVQIL
jgi:hypothetical protein